MEFLISNEKELTKAAKYVLGSNKKVIFLIGDLGSGKTTFTKYLTKTIGIQDNIISPTFILHREYKIPNSPKKFHHIDLYRIEDERELDELMLEGLNMADLIVIEWADRFNPRLKSLFRNRDIMTLEFEFIDESTRRINVI